MMLLPARRRKRKKISLGAWLLNPEMRTAKRNLNNIRPRVSYESEMEQRVAEHVPPSHVVPEPEAPEQDNSRR
jgi:hypothetical protein